MRRKKHTCKEIENAIQHAEKLHWRYKAAGHSAHAWGRLLCPLENKDGCSMSIWSTPRSPEAHAKQIRRRVDLCPHQHRRENL